MNKNKDAFWAVFWLLFWLLQITNVYWLTINLYVTHSMVRAYELFVEKDHVSLNKLSNKVLFAAKPEYENATSQLMTGYTDSTLKSNRDFLAALQQSRRLTDQNSIEMAIINVFFSLAIWFFRQRMKRLPS